MQPPLCTTLAAFTDTSSFTGKVAQIIQFCPADNTPARYHDLIQTRAVYREGSFHAYTVGNTADGKHFADTGTAPGNDDAFKHLYAFAGTFNNLYVNFYGVAGTEFGDIRT